LEERQAVRISPVTIKAIMFFLIRLSEDYSSCQSIST
jgi:hypothetical protein